MPMCYVPGWRSFKSYSCRGNLLPLLLCFPFFRHNFSQCSLLCHRLLHIRFFLFPQLNHRATRQSIWIYPLLSIQPIFIKFSKSIFYQRSSHSSFLQSSIFPCIPNTRLRIPQRNFPISPLNPQLLLHHPIPYHPILLPLDSRMTRRQQQIT